MDDYSALAQRISVSVSGVSGALILSRDGLVLGAYPTEDESLAKPAWLRFVALGEPERSFVEFPDQVWAYVNGARMRRSPPPRPAPAPACSSIRWNRCSWSPRRDAPAASTLRVPDANAAPSGKPRTSLHPQAGKPVARGGPAEVSSQACGATSRRSTRFAQDSAGVRIAAASGRPAEPPMQPGAPAAPEERRRALKKKPQKLVGRRGGRVDEDESEVDRVLLAKEFSGLLQLDSDDDE